MMNDLLDESEPSGMRNRPVFLTVLCILTWVGSAGLLLLSWNQYATAVEMKQQMQELFKQFPGSNGETTSYLDKWILHALAQAAACLLAIAGAIILWNRRKWGFYLYVAGQLLSIAAVFWYAWGGLSSLTGGIEILLITLFLLFPIGFVVMYALNLKHLRK